MDNAYVSNHTFTTTQKLYVALKRVFDVAFAILMLIVLSPVMLVVSIWVKCESQGPVIFRQKRPGYHQKIFTIYKFRSMRTELVDSVDGHLLTTEERLTKSGNILRKASIDELPQLVNIIKGEMSFIGPRPFLINDLDSYNAEQLIRFEVLPGITSWTAIHGRASVSIQEKYDYEIYYVNNIGFKVDFEIFLKTIILVLSGKYVEDKIVRLGGEIIEDNRTAVDSIIKKDNHS
jgi:lipopolysaccharide/colanic/teichoic acid biosynthesis glycosyltransferase